MRYFLLLGLLSLATAGRAQAPTHPGTVRGMLADSATGQPLREAAVSLTLAQDSSYVGFGITDGDGRFALRNVAVGRYVARVSALGFRPRLLPVAVSAANPAPNLGLLRLGPLALKLGEVVVTQSLAPVEVRGDTLDFNARAFKTQPNAAVEALLKKLPGVEVARDGSIRAQGQTVSRVLVDGKPFFGDDPKLATRNLPADLIDRVQLFDQQNDQAAFSGIDDGNRQRTINLVTKRDKRKGWFGANGAGPGTNGRYYAQLGLNRFNNGRQISALAQANNVNEPDFGDNGGPAQSDNGPGAGAGTSGAGGPAIRLAGGGAANPATNPQPDNITESGSVGLNYRDAWGKRAEVATSYLGTRATVSTDQQIRRANVAGLPLPGGDTGPPLLTTQALRERSTTSSHRLNFRLDFGLDSLTSLRLTPYATWQRTELGRFNQQQATSGGHLLNQGQQQYDAGSITPAGGGNALLMRKFARPGRTLSANLNSTLTDPTSTAYNQATNQFFDPAGSPTTQTLHQRVGQATPGRNHTGTLAYTEPLSLRTKLEAHYVLTDNRSDGRRFTTDFDEATGQYSRPNPGLSNEFTSEYLAQRAGLTLQKKRLRYTVGLGLDGQLATQQVRNLSADTLVRHRFGRLLPNALFSYTGSSNRTLRLNYRTRLSPPSATQLQPVRDNANPLSLATGNPNLRPEYEQSLVASYSQFVPATSRSVFALLTGSLINDRIVAATAFSPRGVQTRRPLNANGYASLTGFLSLGQRFAAHQLNLSLTTSGSLTRGPSFLNGQPNTARAWSLGQGASLHSSFTERLEFNLALNATYQAAAYSLLPAQNTSYCAQTLTGDVFYQLPAHFIVTSDVWASNSAGRATGYNPRLVLWNLALARQFFANQQAELKLEVHDLLNQNRSLVRNATETYVEDVRSRVLQRYFLLSFTYNLRQFGK